MSIVQSVSLASGGRATKPSGSGIGALTVAVLAVLLGVAGQGTALASANPTLWNQASASGFPAGSQIYDSVTLGGGSDPTGTLTFKLFGPDDFTCAGTPTLVTTTEVTGNGYYESDRFVTNAAGTYTWMAAYDGDAANAASPWTPCDSSSAQVVVGRRTPVLATSASWSPPLASATGVLTSGSGPTGPAGMMTFNLYGPDNLTCAGAPVFSSVRPVAGHGSYVSAPFVPIAVGAYQWVVMYGGDANNSSRSTMCADESNGFRVSMVPPVVTGTPTTVPRGGTITVSWFAVETPTSTDWVALYAMGTPDGGMVTAWKFTTGTGSGSVSLKFPWGATEGSYEIRLMANATTERLATSGPITLVW